MTDIVERLRAPEAVLDGELVHEAADEIEQLRAALQPFAATYRMLLRQHEPVPSWCSISTNDLWRAAEALEGKCRVESCSATGNHVRRDP